MNLYRETLEKKNSRDEPNDATGCWVFDGISDLRECGMVHGIFFCTAKDTKQGRGQRDF